MRKMDEEAEKEEERRLIRTGVSHEVAEDDAAAEDAHTITTKMVTTWKHREEQGGWLRRARLVARQYKWSVFTDDAFAPTSAYALVRLMIHLAINAEMNMWTVDVKDAFLMVPQPSDENAYVTRGGRFLNLVVSYLDKGQQQVNGSRSSRPRLRSMAWSVTLCNQA